MQKKEGGKGQGWVWLLRLDAQLSLKKRPQTALLDKKLEGIDLGGRGSLHTRPPRRGSLDLSISDIFADAYSPLRSLPDPARDR
jgi:hypothetical protein